MILGQSGLEAVIKIESSFLTKIVAKFSKRVAFTLDSTKETLRMPGIHRGSLNTSRCKCGLWKKRRARKKSDEVLILSRS